MNQFELEQFQRMIDAIMRDPRTSEDMKRRAIASLWTGLETDDIESAEQYEAYKKERAEIELRSFGGLKVTDLVETQEWKAFLWSPDYYRWMALGGAILKWEDGDLP